MSQPGGPDRDAPTSDDDAIVDLYRRSRDPVPWDEHDDAVLDYARRALRKDNKTGRQDADTTRTAPTRESQRTGTAKATPEAAEPRSAAMRPSADTPIGAHAALGGGSAYHRRSMSGDDPSRRRSAWSVRPWAGSLALAASLAVGVVIGTIPDWRGAQAPFVTEPSPGTEKLERKPDASADGLPEAAELSGPPTLDGPPRKADDGKIVFRGTKRIEPKACSALFPGFDPSGRVVVWGFVPSESDLWELRQRMGEVVRDVAVLPPPICTVLADITRISWFPAPTALIPTIEVLGRNEGTGTAEKVQITTPSASPVHLFASLLLGDGTVMHLRSQRESDLSPTAPGATLEVPLPRRAAAGETETRVLLVLASRDPLFSSPRPDRENADAFLADLRRVTEARLRAGSFVVSRYKVFVGGP